MDLKFNREEISWIDPQYLTKEIAQDLAGFWVNTETKMLCCARREGEKIAWYFFDMEKLEWTFLKYP
jgi:hypothetical protein